ncbi:MAG: gluconate 2-dehydrogenase subunit 3 family protein [Acidobacteriota bacterium]|nr:MAG: gluconate 2-dehydrogenase subunit 3 family protein [Acidobacteriota bacterium]
MQKRELSRRAFFVKTGVSVGGAALLYSCHEPGETWSFLTPSEAELLDVLIGRIIPADEDPGAREAGVIYFLDRQLAGIYAQHQQSYREGLKSLESTAQAVHGKSFVDFEEAEQIAFLERLEQNDVPRDHWTDRSPSSFFGMVVDHTMQGFYGSPIHGGNKNYASYKMLKIEMPIDYEGDTV